MRRFETGEEAAPRGADEDWEEVLMAGPPFPLGGGSCTALKALQPASNGEKSS